MVPQTSCGRPHLELLTNSNRYAKQGLLHLKNIFFIKPSIFVLVPYASPEGHLEDTDFRTFRGPSGEVPVTSRAGWDTLLNSKMHIPMYSGLLSVNVTLS